MSKLTKTCGTIGKNIRRARISSGITQEALAAAMRSRGIDVARSTLAKIESGLRNISVDELNAVKEVLEMRYEDFFTRECEDDIAQ